MSWFVLSAGRSGAREVATAMLILWAFVSGWLLWWLPKGDVDAYREIYSTMTTAIFTFSLGAFGISAVMNRLQPVAGPAPRVPLGRPGGDGPERHTGAV